MHSYRDSSRQPPPTHGFLDEGQPQYTDAELKQGLRFWGLHSIDDAGAADPASSSLLDEIPKSLPTPLTTSPDSDQSPGDPHSHEVNRRYQDDHQYLLDSLVSPKDEHQDMLMWSAETAGLQRLTPVKSSEAAVDKDTAKMAMPSTAQSHKDQWNLTGLEDFLDPKACGFDLNIEPLDHLALDDLNETSWHRDDTFSIKTGEPSHQFPRSDQMYPAMTVKEAPRVSRLSQKLSEQSSTSSPQQSLTVSSVSGSLPYDSVYQSRAQSSTASSAAQQQSPLDFQEERAQSLGPKSQQGPFSFTHSVGNSFVAPPRARQPNALDLGLDSHAGEIFPSFLENSIFAPTPAGRSFVQYGSFVSESGGMGINGCGVGTVPSTGQEPLNFSRRGSSASIASGSFNQNQGLAASSYGQSYGSMRRGSSVMASGVSKAGPRSLSRSSSFVDPNKSKRTPPQTTEPLECSNCHTKKTPLWRRNPEGEPLCNACGLFLKLHGEMRPLSLKTDVIRRRNRNSGQTVKSKLSTFDALASSAPSSASTSAVKLAPDAAKLPPRSAAPQPIKPAPHIPIAPKPYVYMNGS